MQKQILAKKKTSSVNPDVTPRTVLDPEDYGGVYLGQNIQIQMQTDDSSSTTENDPASGLNNMDMIEKVVELQASTLQDLEIIPSRCQSEQSASEKVFKMIFRNLLEYLYFRFQNLRRNAARLGPNF